MDRGSNTQVCDGDVLRWNGIVFLFRDLHSVSRSISANMGQKRESEKPHISRQIRLFPRFPVGIDNGVAI